MATTGKAVDEKYCFSSIAKMPRAFPAHLRKIFTRKERAATDVAAQIPENQMRVDWKAQPRVFNQQLAIKNQQLGF